MTNVGNDSTRFKIRQPVRSFRVGAHAGEDEDDEIVVGFKPGPVAPGMHTKLLITLQASVIHDKGGSRIRNIENKFEIVTETEIMHVNVSATVIPKSSYDISPPLLLPHVTLMKEEDGNNMATAKGQLWDGASGGATEGGMAF
ncbi:Sperm-associated antigen 17 [Rhizophlyctis rosea]|nr:Sperm-associated antigen 17 [Rhizophlyctis rosea]